MNFEDFIVEGNKSGDSSLHDWFNKSKSSDGTKGWVQLGGKYAGKPCARQPGQTTKPKCGSSKMKRNLNKKEEDAAFRRKNREDGNPDRKGKAKNVATEGVTFEKFMEATALVSQGQKNNTSSLQDKQAAFNKNMNKDPLVGGLKAVYNAATNLNPSGIVKNTFNQKAADGSLDAAKAKGLVKS